MDCGLGAGALARKDEILKWSGRSPTNGYGKKRNDQNTKKKRCETAALYMTIFLRHNLSIYISLCADLIIFLSSNLSM